MKAQTIRTKMIQTQASLFLMAASTMMLTACGGGFGNGGLTLNLASSNGAVTGGEFSNYNSTAGTSSDGSHSPSSAEVLSLITKPVTEAEAFAAVDATHTNTMKTVAVMAGAEGGTTFDQLSSTGPATPAPSANPYGGVNPVTPIEDPISNPPTGVDNPDTLPTLQSSAAKKGATGSKLVDIIKAGRENVRIIMMDSGMSAAAVEAAGHSESLQRLNMTNLSAETQSLVQANIMVFEAMASTLK